MAMRLHEVHPSLVHFPLTLLPMAIGADAIGRITGNHRLMWLGKRGMAAAAVAGAAAGVTGLIAQEEVNVPGPARDMLITHRNLNIGAVGLMSAMAVRRAQMDRPSLPYLLGGLATIGAAVYSAYLGGTLVYQHGVGVGPAGGTYQGGGPELTPENAGRVAKAIGQGLGQGVKHIVEETAEGKLVPSMTH